MANWGCKAVPVDNGPYALLVQLPPQPHHVPTREANRDVPVPTNKPANKFVAMTKNGETVSVPPPIQRAANREPPKLVPVPINKQVSRLVMPKKLGIPVNASPPGANKEPPNNVPALAPPKRVHKPAKTRSGVFVGHVRLPPNVILQDRHRSVSVPTVGEVDKPANPIKPGVLAIVVALFAQSDNLNPVPAPPGFPAPVPV